MGLWYDEVFDEDTRFGVKLRRTLFRHDGELQTVEIVESERFGRMLVIDGIFMTSEADEAYYHEMMVHPALTSAPRIGRVLVLGGGDGGTVREVLRHPEVEHVTMVELDPVVVEASREHLPTIGTAWDDPRLELRFEDATRFVHATTTGPYDVILLDGSDPVGPAKGLFDRAFYEGCRRLLAEGGLFGLQSESPNLMPSVFLEIQRTLRELFPRVHPCFGPVPLYASGSWSWTICSRDTDPRAPHDERAARLEASCVQYNRAVHRGAFAVPNELRRALGD